MVPGLFDHYDYQLPENPERSSATLVGRCRMIQHGLAPTTAVHHSIALVRSTSMQCTLDQETRYHTLTFVCVTLGLLLRSIDVSTFALRFDLIVV